jgi:hypothetical protein
MLAHIARVYLKLPVLRYVDDYFACEREELAEHAMQSFAELCRLLMGKDVIADRKLQCANPIGVLGLQVQADEKQVHVWPDPVKVAKWSKEIDEVLDRGRLAPSLAAKIAGRLSFAAQHSFLRIGRAPLRPIFTQQYNPLPGDRITVLLRDALTWWKHYLKLPLRHTRVFGRRAECIHVFTDARSTPPRMGAVMLKDGQLYYADAEPDPAAIERLVKRNDQQIMALEMLAGFFGVSTFARTLKGSCIHLWIDNTSGERAFARGSSKGRDHNLMVHHLRLYAAELGIGLEIHRVPSKLNLSDPPSREEYEGMVAHGAKRVEPVLPPLPESWDTSFSSPSKPRKQQQQPTSQRATDRRRQLRHRAHKTNVGPGALTCKQLLGHTYIYI